MTDAHIDPRSYLIKYCHRRQALIKGKRPIICDARPKTMDTDNNHVLSLENINQHILKAEYAVRGELALKAEELAQVLLLPCSFMVSAFLQTIKSDPKSLPFHKITFCNIGNPQQLGQVPISFFRQVEPANYYLWTG
jgi:hypothetical protein